MALQNPLFCYFSLDRGIIINWQRVEMLHVKISLSTWDSYFETIWKALSTFPEATVAWNRGQVHDGDEAHTVAHLLGISWLCSESSARTDGISHLKLILLMTMGNDQEMSRKVMPSSGKTRPM